MSTAAATLAAAEIVDHTTTSCGILADSTPVAPETIQQAHHALIRLIFGRFDSRTSCCERSEPRQTSCITECGTTRFTNGMNHPMIAHIGAHRCWCVPVTAWELSRAQYIQIMNTMPATTYATSETHMTASADAEAAKASSAV